MDTALTPDSGTAAQEKSPAKMGRPSRYAETIAAIICGRMGEGETLRKICRDPEMPSRSTVYRWLDKIPEFRGQYGRAREALVESWADEMVDIADDGTTDYITKVGRNGHEYEAVDQEHIQRSRLRVDTRRWLMSKLNPGQYGDHLEVEQTGVLTVQHELSDKERARRMALFLTENRGVLIEGELAHEEPRSLHADASLPAINEDAEGK